jgi:hypothetical protein
LEWEPAQDWNLVRERVGQNGGGQLKWDVPKASAGIALAGEDDLETVKNLHLEHGELCIKVVVTKFSAQYRAL